ncbi:Protein DEHYDRATION-INDUCED 19-like protein 6 [Raphanus sativus]|nr:Protein DEHYDRATION-INDUCED 19-like protein 6 [Raphanus sativus]
MDSDSWTDRLASASRRYQLDFLSRSDNFLGFEEIEGEDDFREEYACPFCSDYFDIVSLCCHIDEDHPMNTINGVCPVCAVKVSSDMVAHITLQHANMKARRGGGGGAQSMLSILKREFPDGNFQSLFEGSSRVAVPPPSSSSTIAADPLLSSFITPMADELFVSDSAKKALNQSLPQRNVEKKSLSAEDHREKLKQSEFVQGIFSSMILNDCL